MNGYLYSRGLNPTVDILRRKLAALDGAEDCLVFNSGASAIFASVFANVKSGDHMCFRESSLHLGAENCLT
jgi:cystathionine beta-lyase/cystathionine gamma-synthase